MYKIGDKIRCCCDCECGVEGIIIKIEGIENNYVVMTEEYGEDYIDIECADLIDDDEEVI
jgi:hypothetical protein